MGGVDAMLGTKMEPRREWEIGPEQLRPLRRVEYDQLVELGAFHDEPIELLRGSLVTMSPIGPPHSSVVELLTELLVSALRGRARVRIQLPFGALDDSEPEPDVAVVPPADYSQAHPEHAFLVIEVADSSLAQDRGLKRRLYAEADVEEYWVVDVVGRQIEAFRDASAGDWQSVTVHRDAVSPARFPDVKVALADVLPPPP